MDRVTLRRMAGGVLLAAGMIAVFRLGLAHTFSGALWSVFGLGICSGCLFLSWRELLIVPLAIALGAAVVVTAGRQSHPPSDDLPWVVAWVLTSFSLVGPALLGAASALLIQRLATPSHRVGN